MRRHIIATLLLVGSVAAMAYAQTTVYPAFVNCTSTGQLCDPTFEVAVSTQATLNVEFTASSSHCSDIRVHISVDHVLEHTSGFLGPGDGTGVITLGPVTPGSHTIGVQAEGTVGGCNVGNLIAWAGDLSVTTSRYAGTPSEPSCHGDTVSALDQTYGGLANAAQALGFGDVQALQNDIRAHCGS